MKNKKLWAAGTFCAVFASVFAGSSAQDRTDYAYDKLGRLTSACYDGASTRIAYQYDAAGNRSQVTASSAPCSATFSVGNASITEGSALAFTVSRGGLIAGVNAINYATANGTATAGSDYTAAAGTLTFNAGETTKTVSVATTADTVYENNETVLLNLSAPTNNATISDGQATGTITNNDPAPSFAISDASALAGNNLTFTVTKSGSTAYSHSVNYATANGTAVAGSQYTAKSGTLAFTSSQTSQTITVATIAGGVTSGSKTMVVNLSNATSGATIADSQGIGTITAPPVNGAPTAVDDTVTGTFDIFTEVPVHVLVNDSDPENDLLTVTAATCNTSLGCTAFIIDSSTVGILGTTIGIKTATYTISDGHGNTASATITVSHFTNSSCPPKTIC